MKNTNTITITQINNYSKSTHYVYMCIILSIFLIFCFIISPLKQILVASVLGKLMILIILGYALYKNILSTKILAENVPLVEGPWNNIKTNIVASYVFSLFILFLLLSVIRKFF